MMLLQLILDNGFKDAFNTPALTIILPKTSLSEPEQTLMDEVKGKYKLTELSHQAVLQLALSNADVAADQIIKEIESPYEKLVLFVRIIDLGSIDSVRWFEQIQNGKPEAVLRFKPKEYRELSKTRLEVSFYVDQEMVQWLPKRGKSLSCPRLKLSFIPVDKT